MLSWIQLSSYLRSRRSIVTIVSLALILRMFLAPFLVYYYDFSVWLVPTQLVASNQNLYTNLSFSYPPLWAYTFLPLIWLELLFAPLSNLVIPSGQLPLPPQYFAYVGGPGIPAYIEAPAYLMAVKLPLIIGDIGLGALLYSYVKSQSNEKRARQVLVLWLFNPLVIYVSSIHGTFDVLPTFFSFLSMIWLIQRRYSLSALSLAVSGAYKLYAVFYVPVFVYTMLADLRTQGVRGGKLTFKVGSRVALVAAGVLLLFLPVLNQNMLHAIFLRGQVVHSFGGFTPWSIVPLLGVGFPVIQYFLVSNTPTVTLLAFICGFVMAIVFSGFRMNLSREKRILTSYILGMASGYAGLLVVQPQYVLWIIPFLLLYFVLYGSLRVIYYVLTLSAILLAVIFADPLYYLLPSSIFFNIPQPSFLFPSLSMYYKIPWLWVPGDIVETIGVVAILLIFEIGFPSNRRLRYILARKIKGNVEDR